LLCLSTLLKGIGEEENPVLREMLLSGFFSTLESNNMFCRYTISGGNKSQGIFSRHDYQPKMTFTENNPWGTSYGHSTFCNNFEKILSGKEYCLLPYDRKPVGNKLIFETRNEVIKISPESNMICGNSQDQIRSKADLVITDPPYAGNVNYAELADFFYVWLRLILSKTYPHFAPDVTPKTEEIIENPTRGKTAADYAEGLTAVWRKCHDHLDDDGLLIFTFHHADGSAWESLLQSICNSGFRIVAIYPIHGESESSLPLLDKQGISYDLIHVCKKRNANPHVRQRDWASVRKEIRQKAREEIRMIEAGRYGEEKLSPADKNIILIGKCLELYSQFYGAIVDYKGEPVSLTNALAIIRIMAEQLVESQQPLPSELEHVDPVSYMYLTCLCDRKEIKSDEVHKATRGLIEPDALIRAGVMKKGRAKRGRTYEVKLPDERFADLQKLFSLKTKNSAQMRLFPELDESRFDNVALVDVLHFLMGLAQAGENLVPWMAHFRTILPQIRVALAYLTEKNPTFQAPVTTILAFIEV
jgi:adenine-specific DNA methylase